MTDRIHSTTHSGFCGWDIGGAHLKVARCDDKGQLRQVLQYPCALWRGIGELGKSLQQAIQALGCEDDMHAITMTGELVDAFDNRQQGVTEILDCVTSLLPDMACRIFAGRQGWLSSQAARQHWQAVASMNWQASAMFAASQHENGLFIDIGSTTCDIVPFSQHRITPCGDNDHDRQRQGSLVYTGAVRTPLMALADEAPLHGYKVPLTAEWFAISGDIWLLLDKLAPSEILDDSTDGKPWDKHHSRQRIARMLATDADEASAWQWQQVAEWFAQKQLHAITEACLQVMTAVPLQPDSPVIGAGIGRFIVADCARRLQRPYLDFSQLCQNMKPAADHAPAAALALLAQQQLS